MLPRHQALLFQCDRIPSDQSCRYGTPAFEADFFVREGTGNCVA